MCGAVVRTHILAVTVLARDQARDQEGAHHVDVIEKASARTKFHDKRHDVHVLFEGVEDCFICNDPFMHE